MSVNASVFPGDIENLEAAGQLLIDAGESTAGLRLLVFAARIREEVQPPRQVFACDIDESAGMAEVFDLTAYSKRVPCA